MKLVKIPFIAGAVILAGCAMVTQEYSPPEESGLVAVRAFPTQGDVCQVIGESDATVEYLDHTQLLIGCPTNETGAIDDRIAEGAQQLTIVGDWTLLNLPTDQPS